MWKRVSCGLAALLLLAAGAESKRHPSLIFEDTYLEALSAFADGSKIEAVRRVVDLERASSSTCLRAIEMRTAERLAEWNPESLVAQAFLRLATRQARYRTVTESRDVLGFERISIDTLDRMGELYLARSSQRGAGSLVAGLLTYMGYGISGLRSTQRVEAATELLLSALELDPDHPAALHSLAVAHELLGQHRQALPHLDRLLELEPEDPRFRMRKAMATVRSGQARRGRRLLEELTKSGPLWVRDLATQELARLLAASGDEAGAEALLREGLLELPAEKLNLQLAALLDPNWSESWRVLGNWLAGPVGQSGPSARRIYEDGAKEEIDTLRLELDVAVSVRLEGLANALNSLGDPADFRRRTLAQCRWRGR